MKVFQIKHIFFVVITAIGCHAMAGVSTQINDENKVIGEVSYSFEIVINRPAKDVWPHLLNWGSWIEDFACPHSLAFNVFLSRYAIIQNRVSPRKFLWYHER